MAIAFVQVNSATPQSSPSSVAAAYSGAQTAGNLNIVVIGFNSTTATISSVVDTKGNVYHPAAPITRGTASSQAIFYAENIAAATVGANTVTVTFGGATAFPDLRILEYSGIATSSSFDKTHSAIGTADPADSGAAATTTTANQLIFGAFTTENSVDVAGAGYTLRIATSPNTDCAEDKIVSSTGAYNATATKHAGGAVGNWVGQVATFSATSISTATPPRPTIVNQAVQRAATR